MIKKKKKPNLGLVIFGFIITAIIILGILIRLAIQRIFIHRQKDIPDKTFAE